MLTCIWASAIQQLSGEDLVVGEVWDQFPLFCGGKEIKGVDQTQKGNTSTCSTASNKHGFVQVLLNKKAMFKGMVRSG